jgi:hypothetical protein
MSIWTTEFFEQVRREYEAGAGPSEIGRRYGLTRATITAKLQRAGVARTPAPLPTVWTSDRNDQLVELAKADRTPRAIAEIMGATVAAVAAQIAKLRAQGRLPAYVRPPAVKREKPKGESRARAKPTLIVAAGAVFTRSEPTPATYVAKARAFDPLPGSHPIPWTQRAFGQCAWPVDVDPEEQHSCGLRCDEGQTYCAEHLKLRTAPQAPGKPKRSPQELIRALRRYA